jgi:hypothetical protein
MPMGICPGICEYIILDGRYGAVATLRKEPGPYVGGGTTPVTRVRSFCPQDL